MSSIETAIRVLRDEADAILSLIDKLDNNFESAVDLILHANGRVILTGMGKSGHIAKSFCNYGKYGDTVIFSSSCGRYPWRFGNGDS